MARGVAAQGTVVVRIRDNDELIQSVTLTANSAGDAAQIVRLAEARHFAAFGAEIDSEFSFSDAEGYVAVETTCLLEYKPQLYDLYATLRRSSYRGGIDLDGRGIDEDLARDIFIRYRDYGAIVPVSEIGPGMDSVLNQNAVFDAARELSKCVRLLNRHQFVGYAVQDGKSILYLRRWALGMSHNVPIDLLEGIAPAPEAPATDGLTRRSIPGPAPCARPTASSRPTRAAFPMAGAWTSPSGPTTGAIRASGSPTATPTS
jgi:hypothetical protein